MGIDHDWVAVREIVEAGIRDAVDGGTQSREPMVLEENIEDLAHTVTDHLAGSLASGVLVERRDRRSRRAQR
ncbi:hypothetical protein [Allobranchiibius sp. GilTou38]|uniref:hypothetical protein n=1 Tax=Allobranchiibius sp. GilTou38 TaxID=2815210 RepID=UPI001AA10C7A|nr:hypothetical protein [Allobranchiibius sp. GilTou38]MBO1766443.1 hypothetical protein [Allobranchiibius sp. GilTou38]